MCEYRCDFDFTYSDSSPEADFRPDYYANRAGYPATWRSGLDSPCLRRLSGWLVPSSRWLAASRPWRVAVRSRSSSSSALDVALRRCRLGWLVVGRGG